MAAFSLNAVSVAAILLIAASNPKNSRRPVIKFFVQAPLNLFIAWRAGFGLRRDRQLSLVMGVAVFGLGLSVAVLLVVLSVINGFDEALRTHVLRLVPHLILHTRTPADKQSALAGYLAEHEAVDGFAPFTESLALASSQSAVVGVQVSSLTFENAGQHYFFEQQLMEGRLPAQPFEAAIGRVLAQELMIGIDREITLTAPSAQITALGLFARTKTFRVTGILATGTQLDSQSIFVSTGDIERLFAGQSKTQGWRVKVRDLFAVNEIARSFFLFPETDLVAASLWTQTHGSLYEAIQTQKTVMWLLMSLMVALASFNVVSSIGSLAVRRRADIAILMTLGARQPDIVAVFRHLALLVSSLGITLGLLLGILVAVFLDDLYLWFENATSLRLMSQYFIDYLPVRVVFSDMAAITVLVLVLSLLTSLGVAKRVTRIRPAEVLRNA